MEGEWYNRAWSGGRSEVERVFWRGVLAGGGQVFMDCRFGDGADDISGGVCNIKTKYGWAGVLSPMLIHGYIGQEWECVKRHFWHCC